MLNGVVTHVPEKPVGLERKLVLFGRIKALSELIELGHKRVTGIDQRTFGMAIREGCFYQLSIKFKAGNRIETYIRIRGRAIMGVVVFKEQAVGKMIAKP